MLNVSQNDESCDRSGRMGESGTRKLAATRKYRAASRKAATTRKRRAAGRKAATTRKRRTAGRKAAAARNTLSYLVPAFTLGLSSAGRSPSTYWMPASTCSRMGFIPYTFSLCPWAS